MDEGHKMKEILEKVNVRLTLRSQGKPVDVEANVQQQNEMLE